MATYKWHLVYKFKLKQIVFFFQSILPFINMQHIICEGDMLVKVWFVFQICQQG